MLGKKHVALLAMAALLAAAAPLLAQTTAPSPAPEVRAIESNVRPTAGSPTAVQDANQRSRDPNEQMAQVPWYQNTQTLFLVAMVGLVVLMLFFNSRTRKKQESKRNNMLSGMKKGDRVTTIGGIIGTLIEVRDRDVVVKIDEQNNTRVRFLRSAIHSVGEPPAASEQKEQPK